MHFGTANKSQRVNNTIISGCINHFFALDLTFIKLYEVFSIIEWL